MSVVTGVNDSSLPQQVGWRRVTALIRPWRWRLLLIALCVLAAQWLELAPPLLMQRVIDEHLTPGRPGGVLRLALFYLAAIAAAEFFSFLASYGMASVAQGALRELRVRLVAHLHRLPLSYHDQTPLGDVISRCTADVDTVDTLFSSGVANLVANLVRLGTATVAMVWLSPGLTLVALLSVPPIVGITHFFQVRTRTAERANRTALGVLNTHLQETLAGMEVIRAFGRESAFVMRFQRALWQALAAFNRATVYAAIYSPVMGILAALATALLLWAGAGGAMTAWPISIGTLTAFVLLYQRFFAPIITLGNDWQTIQSALSGLERIFQVLALPPEEMTPVSPGRGGAGPQHGGQSAAVALAAVSFGYLPGKPVVQDVTLALGPGEHVAIVGRTGAGKSSLLHLVSGLYAPWSGTVRVAGCDPRTLSATERRRLMGVVPQRVQLFSGTVLDNLTLGDGSLSRTAVERTAAVTGADRFIRTLPDGYDTWLSGSGRGRGVQLSAGQRQLLALTRALVWAPKVLLLDEATDAIDPVREATLRQALRASRVEQGCAVLTVVHRLATAREADQVLVLEAGRVVEAGPPAELVRQGRRLAALVELEAAGWD